MNIKLTKKSKEQLHNQNNGTIELYKNLDEIKPELMYCINKEAINK